MPGRPIPGTHPEADGGHTFGGGRVPAATGERARPRLVQSDRVIAAPDLPCFPGDRVFWRALRSTSGGWGRLTGSEPGGAEGGEMRVYWELAKLGFRRASAYRAAAVSGAITNTFFGFLRAYIFSALYENQADVA